MLGGLFGVFRYFSQERDFRPFSRRVRFSWDGRGSTSKRRSPFLTIESSVNGILSSYPVTRGTMFTVLIASVRPVKSTKSWTYRSTG
jgi:hypothetical protein